MSKTNYQAGHDAEKYAANYLVEHGYKISELNWKTRNCEVDIVASKEAVIYFVEVKYRKVASQGMGLDYITHQKLTQMRFAAEMWVSLHGYQGEYELSAIELAGEHYQVTNFLPNIL